MTDWKTVRYDPNWTETLDKEIVSLCDALNNAGFATTSSCSGHGGDMWPHVYFEHSSDERIEALARFVMATENFDYFPYSSKWQKEIVNVHFHSGEIEEGGYAWCVEVHLNGVYFDTSWEVVLEKAGVACNQVAEAINKWYTLEHED